MPLPRPISVTSQGPALVEGFPHLARIAPIAGSSIFARAGVADGSDRVHVPWSLGRGGEVAIARHRCRGVVTGSGRTLSPAIPWGYLGSQELIMLFLMCLIILVGAQG